MNLSIRTITLTGVALLVVWYALLGGGATLGEAIPAVARYGPPVIVAGPVGLAWDPAGWLVALAILVADVALLVAVRRVRRSRKAATRPRPLTPDDRMWAAHLAWLDECAVRRARERTARAA
jgi:nitrate/nitrite transporter NarK